MITSFKIKPHARSPRYTVVKVFKTLREMHGVMLQDDPGNGVLVSLPCEAAHIGRQLRSQVGTIYLFHDARFMRTAVHELLHAAIYYVAEVRGQTFDKFLTRPNELVSEAEELIAETLENYFQSFQETWTRRLPRIKKFL